MGPDFAHLSSSSGAIYFLLSYIYLAWTGKTLLVHFFFYFVAILMILQSLVKISRRYVSLLNYSVYQGRKLTGPMSFTPPCDRLHSGTGIYRSYKSDLSGTAVAMATEWSVTTPWGVPALKIRSAPTKGLTAVSCMCEGADQVWDAVCRSNETTLASVMGSKGKDDRFEINEKYKFSVLILLEHNTNIFIVL